MHARLPEVHKTRENPFHGSKYADLADITKALLPVLGEVGLVWTTAPTIDDAGRFVLRYALTHVASGEALGGDYTLPSGKPQDLGAAITYARRFAFCAATNLVADEDTDGLSDRGDPLEAAEELVREELNGRPLPDADLSAAIAELSDLIETSGWSRRKVANRFKAVRGHKISEETSAAAIREHMAVLRSVPVDELLPERSTQ